jgi:ubiquinone/menaquinone biosynthesis C-methylase UbiE
MMAYVLHERFDSWADTYDQSLIVKWNRYIQRKVLSEVLLDDEFNRVNVAGGSILDLACGTGHFIQLMSRSIPFNKIRKVFGDDERDIELYGIDASKEMVKQAKAKFGDRFDIRHAYADDTTFEDDKFDYIVCTTAFHHFPDPLAAVREMKRVLKVGGKIIISDLNILPLFVFNRIMKKIEEDFVSMYSRSEFRGFAYDSGLKVMKQKIVGAFGLMSVFEKI